jgi:hypothetical protein
MTSSQNVVVEVDGRNLCAVTDQRASVDASDGGAQPGSQRGGVQPARDVVVQSNDRRSQFVRIRAAHRPQRRVAATVVPIPAGVTNRVDIVQLLDELDNQALDRADAEQVISAAPASRGPPGTAPARRSAYARRSMTRCLGSPMWKPCAKSTPWSRSRSTVASSCTALRGGQDAEPAEHLHQSAYDGPLGLGVGQAGDEAAVDLDQVPAAYPRSLLANTGQTLTPRGHAPLGELRDRRHSAVARSEERLDSRSADAARKDQTRSGRALTGLRPQPHETCDAGVRLVRRLTQGTRGLEDGPPPPAH